MMVQNYTRLFRQKGVASSDVYMYYSTRGDADSLATLVRQHYHGHSMFICKKNDDFF